MSMATDCGEVAPQPLSGTHMIVRVERRQARTG